MKVRDEHATVNGITDVVEFPSGGIQILSDSGHTLFSVSIDGNRLRVKSGIVCKHGGKILDDILLIIPRDVGSVEIIKPEYKA